MFPEVKADVYIFKGTKEAVGYYIVGLGRVLGVYINNYNFAISINIKPMCD